MQSASHLQTRVATSNLDLMLMCPWLILENEGLKTFIISFTIGFRNEIQGSRHCTLPSSLASGSCQ